MIRGGRIDTAENMRNSISAFWVVLGVCFFFFLNREAGEILEQVAQRGCGISILGTGQDSSRDGPDHLNFKASCL